MDDIPETLSKQPLYGAALIALAGERTPVGLCRYEADARALNALKDKRMVFGALTTPVGQSTLELLRSRIVNPILTGDICTEDKAALCKAAESVALKVYPVDIPGTLKAFLEDCRNRGLSPVTEIIDRTTRTNASLAEIVQMMERPEDSGQEFKPHLVTRCVANIDRVEIRWFWPGRFIRGKVNVLAGPPGDGKSFACLDMAARKSSGTPWPDLPDQPNPAGAVLILSGEDDAGDTIRPRLEDAGADLSRVFIVDGVQVNDGELPHLFCMDKHLLALEQKLELIRPDFCVIDPVTCYMGRADTHKESDIRRVLSPLSSLAGKYGTCIMLVAHLNKRSSESDPMNRIHGAVGLPGAARTAWLLKRDPKDADRRIIINIKTNSGPESEARGIAFRIINGRVAWCPEQVTETAADLLGYDPAEGREKAEAMAWLEDRLKWGPVPVKVLEEEVRNDQTFSWVTVKRAKRELGIIASKNGYGGKGGWEWKLPDDLLKGYQP